MTHIKIAEQAESAFLELIEAAKLQSGQVVVIGCSSSEVSGGVIGKNSDINVAQAIFDAIFPIAQKHGLYLACQCCEHLNRALVVERKLAQELRLDSVNAVPQPKAGGSFASAAYNGFENPVLVEKIRADAGMDIGGTLIGMHLKETAIPMRLNTKKIGEAYISSARTRAKFIGGNRTVYDETLL